MKPVINSPSLLTEVHYDDLAHINYHRFLPHPLLRPWVQCYWSVQLSNAPSKPYVERLYPDGGLGIVLNLKNPTHHSIDTQQSLHTLVVDTPLDYIGIRFHPGGAQWLLQQPICDLVNHPCSINDFDLSSIDLLIEALVESTSTTTRLTLVDKWLLDQWQRLQPEVNVAQKLFFPLLEAEVDLNTWCAEQSISRRTLERAFRRYVGISPNHLKSLQQVQRARTLLKEDPAHSLAFVSQASGYYDQAHFTHQFRKVTGQTPGQYQRRQLSKRRLV